MLVFRKFPISIFVRVKVYSWSVARFGFSFLQELLEVVQFTSPSEYIKKPQQTATKSTLESKGKEKYEK